MIKFQIRRKTAKVWQHFIVDGSDFIFSKCYCKTNGDKFRVVEDGGTQKNEYNFDEIEVYNDLNSGSSETFTSSLELMERLSVLGYVGFNKDGDVVIADLISTDPSNTLEEGTDGKLFVPTYGGGGGSWGSITGTLSAQTDLQSALNAKQDTLTFTPEDVANKEDATLDTSTTKYPTNRLVKEYVDANIDNMHREWCSVQARYDVAGVVTINIQALTTSGALAVVARTGTSLYSSLSLQNYVTSTAIGQNAGLKNNNSHDAYIRQGFDAFFLFANNSTDNQHMTTVGSYSLLSAIPNLAISSFTGDFFGVGNDVGDANLSFYAHRVTASGQTASYTKVATSSDFPAHTTTDAYLLRLEAPQTEVQADRYIKMTLTNIVTGISISHTFPYTETPVLNRSFCAVINRNNRNSGTATNIRFSKYNLVKKSY